MAILVFTGSVLRGGRGKKIPVLDGLVAAFVPFFVIMCLMWILEYSVGVFGVILPAKPFGAIGGIGGYLGNYWISALQRNGRSIAKQGALQSLLEVIKGIVNLKKFN